MLDGLLVIDKPQGCTSHDAVGKCRKLLNTKKIGHTGTLDPLATGVMVVCVGKATKLSDMLMCDDKIYEVTMQFGIQTDTADITGNVLKSEDINIDRELLQEVLKYFIGKQEQVPPMYSAIKQDGKKLYELARKGIEVERKAREIEIFSIDSVLLRGNELCFTTHVSKGTYIRVLCEDIAKKIGTIATMTSLRRIQSGCYTIDEAISLDEVSEEKIIPIEKVFDKKIMIEKDLDKLLNGMKIRVEQPDGYYNLYTDHYIGIGKIENNFLKREIIL